MARAAILPGQSPPGGPPTEQAEGPRKAESRAVVGGVEFVFGGWGEFAAQRRREQWEQRGIRPGRHYPGRSYIGPDEAARSLLSEREPLADGSEPPLQQAALQLARALGSLEDRLCSPDGDGAWECAGPTGALRTPALVSTDLTSFAADPAAQVDAAVLRELGLAAREVAAEAGVVLPAVPELERPGDGPPLPPTLARVDDDAGVLELESSVRPQVSALEDLQAAVARCLSSAAAALERRAPRAKGAGERARAPRAPPRQAGQRAGRQASAPSRGEAVDLAAKAKPPLALLSGSLPFAGARSFSVEGDTIRVDEAGEVPGLFFGFALPDTPDRETRLTPWRVSWAARMTSGRVYAWVLFDSAEARYAVRAEPVGGRVLELNPDELTAWLRPRLVGDPPHKIASEVYVAHLRGLGLEVLERGRRFPETRFCLVDMVSEAERKAEVAALRALSERDFLSYDWRDFDKKFGRIACTHSAEFSGEVVIDWRARRVLAPKVREGWGWASRTYTRGYASVHSHPLLRFRGLAAEPPSLGDLRATMWEGIEHHVWMLVAAPEGVYIVRSTAFAQEVFSRDPEAWEAQALLAEAALGQAKGRAPAAAAAAVVAALADAGFVAYFRPTPCAPLSARPDLLPQLNKDDPAKFSASMKRIGATPAAALAAADWRDLDRPFATAPGLSWAVATLEDGVVRAGGDSHRLGDLKRPESYPTGLYGPIVVFYVPADKPFPGAVPHAALEAFRRSEGRWVWAAFLSPARLLLFRAGPSGVEIFGPVTRPAARPLEGRRRG